MVSTLADSFALKQIRNDWSAEEVAELYQLPLLELIFQAQSVTRQWHEANSIQVNALLSIKTGGCPDDCGYCGQSAHHQGAVKAQPLISLAEVLEAAHAAKKAGATRLCMGAAWHAVRDNQDFERVLEMVAAVSDLGLEVCCTLGMVNEEQARRLKDAGLFAYNHNIDTSPEFYGKVVSTRTYHQRIETLRRVRQAQIHVCCGVILGLGESTEDRISFLHALATMDAHPDSVPINCLVPIAGTPLAEQERTSPWELIRVIAVARLLMPKAVIRLSAGRSELSFSVQALCFLAGANSIFIGSKLLTVPNVEENSDAALFELLGLHGKKSSFAEL